MNTTEICLNLWYIRDVEGFIYSLRARANLLKGSDTEKLRELQRLAKSDFLIAKSFPIPAQYSIKGMPICHIEVFEMINKVDLFKEAILFLQNELPAQTTFDIPDQPLVCITPLLGDESGNISLKIDEIKYL